MQRRVVNERKGASQWIGMVERVELENYAAGKCANEEKNNICVNLIEL